jgi:hypothetical protein
MDGEVRRSARLRAVEHFGIEGAVIVTVCERCRELDQ